MTVPYAFSAATSAIPLSQLDDNFNTTITLGNTAIQLGNTVTTLNNMTLANVTISSGNVTITNVTVTTANVTTVNATTVIATTANVTTGNITNLISSNVALTGGAINGTTLGATTAASANVTTLTTSSTVTLNGGTANGVAYLNGSKVLTTGSALQFDGTNLGIGAAPTGFGRLDVRQGTNFRILFSGNAAYGSNGIVGITDAGAETTLGLAGTPIAFYVQASEQMRLNSTGLGIGTSSPTQKLTLVNNAASTFLNTTDNTVNTLYGTSTGLSAGLLGTLTNHPLVFYANNGEKMRLDSSGRFGIGVTPIATGANGEQLQIGNAASTVGAGLTIGSTNTADIQFSDATSGTGQYAGLLRYAHTDNSMSFWTGSSERARITSGGDLLVGTQGTTDPGCVLAAVGRVAGTVSSVSTASFQAWNQATSGDNLFQQFYTEGGGGTLRGSIDYNRAGGLTRYNTTSDYRAKDILGPVANPGATIDALKVYEGQMKGATQPRPMLVAHEAQEHAPYAVSGVKDEVNEDGTPKYQQMDHASLVPLLIAEIQSLRQRVAQLEGA